MASATLCQYREVRRDCGACVALSGPCQGKLVAQWQRLALMLKPLSFAQAVRFNSVHINIASYYHFCKIVLSNS